MSLILIHPMVNYNFNKVKELIPILIGGISSFSFTLLK